MERTLIRPGWLFWLLAVIFGPVSFFVVPIALWASMRNWPRLLDNEGLQLRSGMRIPWSACTNMVKFGAGRFELVFGGTTVQLPTSMIAGGKQVAEAVRQRLGVTFK